ncbi:MAG TPA: quinone oxidoreductase [Dehalococcoidia bacterium]|nr:quinone oxidoreductase [Dehalococcoidia bacterium]
MKAVRFHELGGPDVLRYEDVPKPLPQPGEALIRVAAAGVNYADTFFRQGKYLVKPQLPQIPGLEVAGTVVAVGDGVREVTSGDRVLALLPRGGGYAEYVTAPAASLLPVPDELELETAAAIPVQGLTAHHVLSLCGRLSPGESVLVHAAAGGVGSLAIQIARLLGAGTVIATASSQSKLDLARSLGANVTINYREEDFVPRVNEATKGQGVDVIIETVGGDVLTRSLSCLAPFGRLVVAGMASGEASQIAAQRVLAKNQSIVGYYLMPVIQRHGLADQALAELMAWSADGQIQLTISQVRPLAEAAWVHEEIEARRTVGKLVLRPGD